MYIHRTLSLFVALTLAHQPLFAATVFERGQVTEIRSALKSATQDALRASLMDGLTGEQVLLRLKPYFSSAADEKTRLRWLKMEPKLKTDVARARAVEATDTLWNVTVASGRSYTLEIAGGEVKLNGKTLKVSGASLEAYMTQVQVALKSTFVAWHGNPWRGLPQLILGEKADALIPALVIGAVALLAGYVGVKMHEATKVDFTNAPEMVVKANTDRCERERGGQDFRGGKIRFEDSETAQILKAFKDRNLFDGQGHLANASCEVLAAEMWQKFKSNTTPLETAQAKTLCAATLALSNCVERFAAESRLLYPVTAEKTEKAGAAR